MVEETYKKIGGEIGFSYVLLALQIVFAPLVVALLTRLLGKDNYGIYALFSVFIGLFSLALQPGFSQYLITRLPGIEKKKWSSIFFSLLVFELVLLGGVLSIFYFTPIGTAFLSINKLSGYSTILLISLGIIFFGTFSGIFDYYYRAKQNLNLANLMEFIRLKGWGLPLFLAYFYIKKFNLATVFLAWALFTLSIVIIYLWLSRKELFLFLRARKIDYKILKTALKFGVPIIPANILSWVIVASDRYILNYFTSVGTVGLYSLAYSLLGIIYTLGMTANGVILPYFSEAKWKDKKKYNLFFSASVKYGLMVVLPGIVGILLLRKEIITLISGSAYLAAAPVVISLALYPLFGFLFYMGSNTLILNGKTILSGGIYLFAAILNVVLNFALIPTYGMHGSAIATVISYVLMCILALYFARKYIRFDFKFIKIPGILISSAIMGIVLYFLHPTNAITKILTLLVGVGVYFGMILATKVLEKRELELVKSSIISVLRFGREDFTTE